MDLIQQAALYSREAHSADGNRQSGFEPDWQHSAAVAIEVQNVSVQPEVIAAAYLHATVKVTHITLQALEREFGKEVAEYVDQLTSHSGSWEVPAGREPQELDCVAHVHPNTQTIMYAVLICNFTSILLLHSTENVLSYLQSKRALLSVMTDGNSLLLQKAWRVLNYLEMLYEVKS